ncbi:MAG: TlyA family RNA methyltransferase [Burkholderiaceae bacterium]
MSPQASLRTDQQLLLQGLVRSRSEAQRLLQAGCIRARLPDGTTIQPKASTRLPEQTVLERTDEDAERFVSRGGLKLAGALARFAVPVAGRLCLDVGQSTGGFTDCLLRRGARHVVGLDVGHGQIDPALRTDERVLVLEKIHIGHCSRAVLVEQMHTHAGLRWPGAAARVLEHGFDLVVADLSFISQRKVLAVLAALLADDGDLVTLVKPQFELGPGAVNKQGLVRDASRLDGLADAFGLALAEVKLQRLGWMDSPILGGDGNREFLLHARHRRTRQSPSHP